MSRGRAVAPDASASLLSLWPYGILACVPGRDVRHGIPAVSRSNLKGVSTEMALNKTEKDAIIQEYHVHPNDTGSPEVQVAILTKRINTLIEHLKLYKGDQGSQARPAEAGRPTATPSGVSELQGPAALSGAYLPARVAQIARSGRDVGAGLSRFTRVRPSIEKVAQRVDVPAAHLLVWYCGRFAGSISHGLPTIVTILRRRNWGAHPTAESGRQSAELDSDMSYVLHSAFCLWIPLPSS